MAWRRAAGGITHHQGFSSSTSCNLFAVGGRRSGSGSSGVTINHTVGGVGIGGSTNPLAPIDAPLRRCAARRARRRLNRDGSAINHTD